MSDETPRLNLDTYEPGDTDWDHTDAVEAIDETAIERGPISERPSEGDYDDELYHAVDQRITWRWDASSEDWEPIGGMGSEDDPLPGTAYREAVNADHASIDETIEIFPEDDIDDLLKQSNLRLVLAPGTYNIDESAIELGHNLVVEGYGHRHDVTLVGNGQIRPGDNNLFRSLTFDCDNDDGDNSELIRGIQDPENLTLEDIRFVQESTGGTVEHYIRTSGSGTPVILRGCKFDEPANDDEIRIGEDESTIVNCTGLTSFDDRGTDNVTAGNTPLDAS